jgi:hypothetical protein
MAMGNNPMIYVDADGRIFKKALNWIGEKVEQFVDWAQESVPYFQVGMGIGPEGQMQPIGYINDQPLFNNESQYEASAQNAVDAINEVRGEYFNQESQY